MARALSEIRPLPRRGLSREEAAMYIGVSAAKFDQLVADGRMPAARRIDGRKVWALPQAENTVGNSWDDR